MKSPNEKRKHLLGMVVLVCVLLACILNVAGCGGVSLGKGDPRPPKSIIIILADGVAATQWDFGRRTSALLRREPFATADFFREETIGLLISSSHDAYVTDSAAAGSAMATGFKVENGVISMTPDGRSPRTVMEAAKAAGKRIGLVTTAPVHDATPAAFSLHSRSRRDAQGLVDRYLALEPDVLMGGGEEYFLPETAGGKRRDGRDIIAAFRSRGWQVVRSTVELKAATGMKMLGLFADGDMDFDIERDPARQPTLAEMTVAALRALSQENPHGFVLLVESENTDVAGHANDAAMLMRSLWAVDDAVKVAMDFRGGSPETLLLIAGDHETGGLSVTHAQKAPSALSGGAGDEGLRRLGSITMSFRTAAEEVGQKPSAEGFESLLAGHFPGFVLDADLREMILTPRPLGRHPYVVQNALGQMVARQTGICWGTRGHTAEPVLVGASGPGADLFRGYRDNTDFGRSLHRLLGPR
jgi:alkaline phosphatase